MARQLLDAVSPASRDGGGAASNGGRGSDASNHAGGRPAAEGTAAPHEAEADAAVGRRQAAAWRHWAGALPRSVPLAFAHASEAELRRIGDEALTTEALAVRRLMLDSHEVGFCPSHRSPQMLQVSRLLF